MAKNKDQKRAEKKASFSFFDRSTVLFIFAFLKLITNVDGQSKSQLPEDS